MSDINGTRVPKGLRDYIRKESLSAAQAEVAAKLQASLHQLETSLRQALQQEAVERSRAQTRQSRSFTKKLAAAQQELQSALTQTLEQQAGLSERLEALEGLVELKALGERLVGLQRESQLVQDAILDRLGQLEHEVNLWRTEKQAPLAAAPAPNLDERLAEGLADLEDRLRRDFASEPAAPVARSIFDVSDEALAALPSELNLALTDLVRVMLKYKAQELFLKAGRPPMVHVGGELRSLGSHPLGVTECRRLILPCLPLEKREMLHEQEEVEHSLILEGSRFRVSVFLERSAVSAVLRRLSSSVPTLEDLGLPRRIERLALQEHGLVLITGASMGGKSWTLAALMDHINARRRVRLFSLEDPIEFLHEDKKAYITQREIGTDARNFAEAVRHAVRQAPQVLVLSDLPDPASARLALQAAESGMLVLAVVRSDSVIPMLERLTAMFPKDDRPLMSQMLADNLVAAVAQTILPRQDGYGGVVATELLLNTPHTYSCLQDGIFRLLEPLMAGGDLGMHTLEQSLEKLRDNGVVSPELVGKRTSPSSKRSRGKAGPLAAPPPSADTPIPSPVRLPTE